MKFLKTNPLILVIILLLASCDGDDPKPEPKSIAKSITSFKFSALTPEAIGTINESAKEIALTLPAGTDITALVPTIVVSEKATVSPASGVAQNFTNPVIYAVTAEDGSTQEYEVTVTVLEPKSSAKSISSFKFAGLTPEVTGTISEVDKTISLTVPNGTDVTALVPTIVVSAEATVTPASGVAQNFTSPVTYTVTAEDESTQEYNVTVIIDETVDFTVNDHTNVLELEQDGVLFLTGSGFGNFENNKVVFIDNTDENNTIEIEAVSPSDDETLFFPIPADFPLGEYQVRIFVGTQSLLLDGLFTVIPHSPEITGVDKTSVVRGENLIITGNYFAAFDNEVYLTNNVDPDIELTIVAESTTEIEVTVPDDLDPGDYTLSVKSNSQTTFYNEETITVTVPANIPVITEITDTSIARGETMVIKGINLKKTGVATNLNFIPWPNGGATIVRSAVANAEGTEATFVIPGDFPTGTYEVVVEVDFEFSESYDEIIQIQ